MRPKVINCLLKPKLKVPFQANHVLEGYTIHLVSLVFRQWRYKILLIHSNAQFKPYCTWQHCFAPNIFCSFEPEGQEAAAEEHKLDNVKI